jgi:hypothetical protein
MEYEITITFKADDKGTAEAYFDIVSSIAPWMVDNVITSMVEEMA